LRSIPKLGKLLMFRPMGLVEREGIDDKENIRMD
jgi:hypothetical protein